MFCYRLHSFWQQSDLQVSNKSQSPRIKNLKPVWADYLKYTSSSWPNFARDKRDIFRTATYKTYFPIRCCSGYSTPSRPISVIKDIGDMECF